MTTPVVDLGKGVIYQPLHNNRIHSYRVEKDEHGTFMTLFDHVEELLENSKQSDDMVLTLYDFTKTNVLNPVGRERGSKLMRNLPEGYRSKTAIILSKNVMGRVIKAVVQGFSRISGSAEVEVKFFFDYESGLKWLEESL